MNQVIQRSSMTSFKRSAYYKKGESHMIDWIKKKSPHWISSTILIWNERQYDIIHWIRERISKERIWFKTLAQERGQDHITIIHSIRERNSKERIWFKTLAQERGQDHINISMR